MGWRGVLVLDLYECIWLLCSLVTGGVGCERVLPNTYTRARHATQQVAAECREAIGPNADAYFQVGHVGALKGRQQAAAGRWKQACSSGSSWLD